MVNIFASNTSISVIADGVTVFTRSVPMGGNQYTEEIQRQLSISFREAEDLKLGKEVGGVDASELATVIDSVNDNMVLEARRSIDFFLGGSPGTFINRIYLSGGGSKVKDLPEKLQESTSMPVEMANPFNGIGYNPKTFDPEYLKEVGPYFAVAVGLATRRLGDR